MVSTLNAILPQEVELGAHTGVVLLQEGEQRTFIWTHPANRPWGFDVRPQCDKCQVLKPWATRLEKMTIFLTCKNCGHTVKFNRPNGLHMMGSIHHSPGGWWGFTREALQSSSDIAVD
jgi:hypothetical protein